MSIREIILSCTIALTATACQPPLGTLGEVEKVETGFGFVEGPCATANGDLYFTDVINDKVYQYDTKGNLKVILDSTAWGNGLFVRPDGSFLMAQSKGLHLIAVSTDLSYDTLATGYEGNPFNSPNDVWEMPSGGIYFSDPNYNPNKEVEHESVYYIEPSNRKVIRATEDLVRPNGLIGSQDGLSLYITDHGDNKTWKYQVNTDGTLSNKELFAQLGGDGVTMDMEGRLYITNLPNSSVDVFDDNGSLILQIPIPEVPSNVAFGGIDNDELFITARTSLYKVKMNTRGS